MPTLSKWSLCGFNYLLWKLTEIIHATLSHDDAGEFYPDIGKNMSFVALIM
jgi:hypothetical protein